MVFPKWSVVSPILPLFLCSLGLLVTLSLPRSVVAPEWSLATPIPPLFLSSLALLVFYSLARFTKLHGF